jgi:hydroxylaminobenzene mutase
VVENHRLFLCTHSWLIRSNFSIWKRQETKMDDSRRRLIWHGMFLFLLGLLTGFVELQFTNQRMGLAAHLEGVMNGIFLLALGAVWAEVRLPPRARVAAYWGVLYGTYANWAVTTLAAILGTAALSPITASGHSAQPWQEGVVTFGFHQRRARDCCVLSAGPLGLAGIEGGHDQRSKPRLIPSPM